MKSRRNIKELNEFLEAKGLPKADDFVGSAEAPTLGPEDIDHIDLVKVASSEKQSEKGE